MTGWWLWASLALAGPSCDLGGEADAPFAAGAIEAPQVRLVIEVWVRSDDQLDWARGLLTTLAAAQAPATVVLPLRDEPSDELLAFARDVQAGPNSLGLRLYGADVPTDVLAPVRPLRRKIKPYEEAARIRTSYSAVGGRGTEALLGKAGFRNLVQLEAAATAEPRIAGHFEGQQRVNVVLPPGPYRGPCGPNPVVGPFTPRAADRATEALLDATRASSATPVVRVGLDGARQSASDAEVLERWLREVVQPAKVQVVLPNDARLAALQGFRRADSGAPAPARPTGRLLPVGDLRAAADDLAAIEVLPYHLPSGLTPTEAFVGLLVLAAGETSSDAVRLRAVRGPAQDHNGTGEPTPIDPDALRATATRLLAALPDELPAALPVDGKLLSAGQWLSALASLARGDEPVMALPLDSPDPNARGLGWGTTD